MIKTFLIIIHFLGFLLIIFGQELNNGQDKEADGQKYITPTYPPVLSNCYLLNILIRDTMISIEYSLISLNIVLGTLVILIMFKLFVKN